MSYDIRLKEPVTDKQVYFDEPHQMIGGTYAIGGTNEARLNVTYNYGRWYRRDDVFGKEEGINIFDGMMAADSIPILEKAIQSLQNTKDELSEEEIKSLEEEGVDGYWMPTKENAMKPLYQLLAMAKMRPDAIWEVF